MAYLSKVNNKSTIALNLCIIIDILNYRSHNPKYRDLMNKLAIPNKTIDYYLSLPWTYVIGTSRNDRQKNWFKYRTSKKLKK